jgi:hypothetical protein
MPASLVVMKFGRWNRSTSSAGSLTSARRFGCQLGFPESEGKHRRELTHNITPRAYHITNRLLPLRQPQSIPRRSPQRSNITIIRSGNDRNNRSERFLHAREEVLGSGETADEDDGVDSGGGDFGELVMEEVEDLFYVR